jgi:transaldolase
MTQNPLRQLAALGQQVWLDDIRRGMIESGELARLIADDGVAGLTSNPAIFAKAIADTREYDTAIRAATARGADAEAIYEELAIADVRAAADAFAATYQRTQGDAGYVSLEISPRLADDSAASIAAVRRLWAAVSRPNVMIKVPATIAGIPVIRQAIAAGINVNVTLIFSVMRYREVFDAFVFGLQDRVASREPLAGVASVASFFLSRIDSAIDPRLETMIGNGDISASALLGQSAIASAASALAEQRFLLGGSRWRDLAAAGARPQKLLWASTSTKNKAYSDVKYVEELIASGTVNTMPPETVAAYRDHGKPELRTDAAIRASAAVVTGLNKRGIDLESVADQLERDGVRKFVEPYDRLLAAIAAKAAR